MARRISRTQFVQNEIARFVKANPLGTSFTAHDLYLCGSTDQVNRILAGLTQRGQIRRIGRGRYQS